MKQNRDILKSYFETGDKPTQQQYEDLIDSFIHQDNNAAVKYFDFSETDGHIRQYTNVGTQSQFSLDTNETGIFYCRIQNNDHDIYDGYEIYIFNKGQGIWGGGEGATAVSLEDFTLIYRSQYATNLSLGFRDDSLECYEHHKLSEYLSKIRALIPARTIENIDINNGYLQLTTDDDPRQIVAQISLEALKRALDDVVYSTGR